MAWFVSCKSNPTKKSVGVGLVRFLVVWVVHTLVLGYGSMQQGKQDLGKLAMSKAAAGPMVPT